MSVPIFLVKGALGGHLSWDNFQRKSSERVFFFTMVTNSQDRGGVILLSRDSGVLAMRMSIGTP